jgi:hypothetical protein
LSLIPLKPYGKGTHLGQARISSEPIKHAVIIMSTLFIFFSRNLISSSKPGVLPSIAITAYMVLGGDGGL